MRTNLPNSSDIFLTDDDYKALFGGEIYRITGLLNDYSMESCSDCKGDCCKLVDCKLYSKKLGRCPIYRIRPRECRYHFCNKILSEAPLNSKDKELLIQPVIELLGDKKGNISRLLTRFPHFPLNSHGLALLGIAAEVKVLMSAFENGNITETELGNKLETLCLNAAQNMVIALSYNG